MLDPINLTVAAMHDDMQRMNVIANNSANVSTPGFKREFAVASTLATGAQALSGASPSSESSIPSSHIVRDDRPGTPRQTGAALDLAILGQGYFEVQGADMTAYTRKGDFRLDAEGRLVTQSGMLVQGTAGEIRLGSPTPVIDRLGRVFESGKQVAQIKIVDFRPAELLNHLGGGLLVPASASAPHTVEHPKLGQGQLEASNVDSTREMVSLLETFRHFEGAGRVLQAYDDLRDKTIRTLGQF